MGKCIYCGKSAGLFRKEHRDCRASFYRAYNEITYVTQQSILDRDVPLNVEAKLLRIASAGRVSPESMRSALIRGWVAALHHFSCNSCVSEETWALLAGFKDYFALTVEELHAEGVHARFANLAPKEGPTRARLPTIF